MNLCTVVDLQISFDPKHNPSLNGFNAVPIDFLLFQGKNWNNFSPKTNPNLIPPPVDSNKLRKRVDAQVEVVFIGSVPIPHHTSRMTST